MKKTFIAAATVAFITTGAFAGHPANHNKPAPKPIHVVEHNVSKPAPKPALLAKHHEPKPAPVVIHHKPKPEPIIVHHHYNNHTDLGDVLIAFAILATAL